MTWLEILWAAFWRSLLWRQHERPYSRAFAPDANFAPMGENREEKALASVDRHSGLPTVARLRSASKTA